MTQEASEVERMEFAKILLRSALALLVGLALGIVVRAGLLHEPSGSMPMSPSGERSGDGPRQHSEHAERSEPSEQPERGDPGESMSHGEQETAAADPQAAADPALAGLPALRNPVCPIMGNPIEDPEVDWVLYEGTRVNFCCPPCFFDFAEEPLARLDELESQHGVTVPTELRERIRKFPEVIEVENERSPLGGGAIDEDHAVRVVHHGVAFHLAGPSEVVAFLADPGAALAALAAAGHEIPEARR